MSAADESDPPDDDAPTGVFVRPGHTERPPRQPAKQAPTSHRPDRDAEMLTVKEAAGLLRVNIKTVYQELAAGRLPYVQLGRRIIRIPRSVIASLISKSA